jgi:mannose-6-phosphate isomerase
MEAECLTFKPLYKERIWGGRKLETYFDRTLPSKDRIGESWELVDREDAQSIVSSSKYQGASLHEIWVNERRELFGEGYDSTRFPILVKILDASETLSLQVHPGRPGTTNLLAEAKTEFWYFVATGEGAGLYIGLKNGVEKKDFETALSTGEVLNLLHRVPSYPDGYIFIPGGRLHAIGAGNLLFEIQQNSDTTYRVFDWNRVGEDGEARQLHIEQSLRCIDFGDFEPALGQRATENLVACNWFSVDRWLLKQGRQANIEPRFAIFQVVAGTVSFGAQLFRRGDLFLVPASSHQSSVEPRDGEATVLRTTL